MVRSLILVTLVLVALTLAGCTTPNPGAGEDGSELAPPMPVLAFTATQEGAAPNITYSFGGPDTVEAGWVTLDLTTNVFEPHQVLFMELRDGMTFSAFEAQLHAAAADPSNFTYPASMVPRGGVGVVTYEQKATAHVELPAGDYAIVCQIPGPIGPHMVHGMAKPFTVKPRTGVAPEAPVPNFTLTMTEYGFELDKNVTPGRHTFAIHNAGTQAHEAPLVRLAANATIQSFLEAIERGDGPPPGVGVGGTPDIRPGGTAYATVDFEPGDYGTFCFVLDAADRVPHLVHGMVTQFTVA